VADPDLLANARREIDYYRRQLDELGGESVKLDYVVSGLRHQLNQKRQAFTLLSDLQRSIAAQPQVSAIFDLAIRAINATLVMDRTVVLIATATKRHYRPNQWVGFPEALWRRFGSLTVEFPEEFAAGGGWLLANKASPPTPLIDSIRQFFDLPHFVALPVPGDQGLLGILLTGRLKEAKPLYPPFDQGDVETLQALASLISSYVRTLRIGVLEEANRLKAEFFANISHEFRTPITLTLGPLEQILANRYGEIPESVRVPLQMVVRNQEQLLGLVNQILDLARFEAGGMQLKVTAVPDMNRFVEERLSRFGSAAEDRGIDLRISLDPRVAAAEIFVDAEKFSTLLFNLLSNAFKFTHQGRIEVSTTIDDETFRLAVADTGVGIKEDQLPYIFDRFRQADGSESRAYAGTGIGLALVKEIAELHGGAVRAFSQYGVGSTFEVTIPRGRAPIAAEHLAAMPEHELAEPGRLLALGLEMADGSELADPGEFDPTRPTILYADDNRDMRCHVRDLLGGEYNVLLATDGGTGIEKARCHHPDLVLTDQMMPRMSGRDLLRAIRNDPALAGIPVIFLTARAGTEARIESLDAGADDYLAKPFHAGELTARVRNLLRARTQEQELARLNHDLAALNASLEGQVAAQVGELERLQRLRRFLAPQVAELIVNGDVDDPLRTHRREVVAVFVDLRGFTEFAESVEPEEVMGVLRDYNAVLGELIIAHEGTVERFTGDGMIVLFNDPVPISDPAGRAIRMAAAMRDDVASLIVRWRRFGYELDFGVGIAQGYATIGAIGFEQRYDYTAIGSVMNLASRLCGEAKPGQILISQRVFAMVEDSVAVEPVGPLALKGFRRPVPAYNILSINQP
jgi:signal transduction histidine kinase/class 3 adenylate cyclase/CheY-like chemotaxis protein